MGNENLCPAMHDVALGDRGASEAERRMQSVMMALKAHFDSLQDRFRVFEEYGVQTEGWFKGEMLLALGGLAAAGQVKSFDREVKVGSGKKVDLRIDLPGGRNWVELKHWLIGKQKGTMYDAPFYFGDPTSVGIRPDVEKLAVNCPGARWILVLMTKNPGDRQWQEGLRKYSAKFGSPGLLAQSRPTTYPDSYFLGLLEVA